jgi:hypothetical protein
MAAGIGLKVVAVLLMLGAPVVVEGPVAEVKVTQRYLEPVCLDGKPVTPGERRWGLSVGAHSLSFTMRNDPRQGVEPHQKVQPKQSPGVAEVSFTVEAGHRYEVEVRGPAMAYSTRVWERGEWKPVVRDRTADRVISGEPEWRDSGCQSGHTKGTEASR